MPARNPDLHGSAPDKSEIALLLIDVINDLDFPEANQLLRFARPMARKLLRLKQRAKKAGIPVIYVNDNFGRWQSDFRRQVQHCLREDSRGHGIVSLLRPQEDDYFVLKPKHSGFEYTSLDVLLKHLGVDALVLCGVAANFCVLFTAHDAYMREYRLIVPSDCVASLTRHADRYALAHMADVTKADVRPSVRVNFTRR